MLLCIVFLFRITSACTGMNSPLNLTDFSGTISTPGWPNGESVKSGETCEWNLTPPKGKYILLMLNFTELQTYSFVVSTNVDCSNPNEGGLTLPDASNICGTKSSECYAFMQDDDLPETFCETMYKNLGCTSHAAFISREGWKNLEIIYHQGETTSPNYGFHLSYKLFNCTSGLPINKETTPAPIPTTATQSEIMNVTTNKISNHQTATTGLRVPGYIDLVTVGIIIGVIVAVLFLIVVIIVVVIELRRKKILAVASSNETIAEGQFSNEIEDHDYATVRPVDNDAVLVNANDQKIAPRSPLNTSEGYDALHSFSNVQLPGYSSIGADNTETLTHFYESPRHSEEDSFDSPTFEIQSNGSSAMYTVMNKQA
uniref:uncharacterized protein LOC120343932 n=1 Tax=Styela clava TaxID=7725 RepID=UPI0019399E97|nr:uncharacterized protein LOC120343932 [Styela clava]